MLKFTVSRDDSIYEGFPDIAMAKDGTLVCVYRESMGHAPFPFSTIAIRRSRDGGRTWLPKQIIAEAVESKESINYEREWMEPYQVARWEEMYDRATAKWPPGAINCTRLTCLADGTLFLIADFYSYDEHTKDTRRYTNRIWRSKDSGLTWEGPEIAKLPEGIVPSVTQLRNGEIMVGLTYEDRSQPRPWPVTQFVYRSSDGGHAWTPPVKIPVPVGIDYICEMSVVELDDGMLVGILRAAKDWTDGYKVFSDDRGETWRGPFETHMYCLSGRPKASLLKSGEVCITYRHCGPNESLTMHVVTQDGLRLEKRGDLIPRQPTPEESVDIKKGHRRFRSKNITHYYPGRTFCIDIDRSVHRDSGYSGWVQLGSGEIYVVDYINDDAPMAYIRGYLINRSDYILFPDGDLPWLHPAFQPYTKMTSGMAERQYMKNRKDTIR